MKALFRRLLAGKSNVKPEGFEIHLDGNSSGQNILIFTEYVNATYFISFDIPLRRMHARGEINFAVVSQKYVGVNNKGCWKRWAETFKPDIVIMTRYALPYGVEILDYFKECNTPVIYHIDDDLLELPASLGAEIQKRQGATDTVNARKYLLEHADILYASTTHLAGIMLKRFPKQKVMHGIYAPYMGNEILQAPQSNNKHKIIGYMGSKGHQHDLELVVPALERLLDEQPLLHFETFGTIRMPEQLQRFGSRVISRTVQKSYVEFLGTLSSLDWDIGLAPLVNEPFNQCKAPTKFIEYTACRIPVIASNISVYSKVIPEGGGLLVKNNWYAALSRFLRSSQDRSNSLSISQQYCKKNYALLALEKQLTQVFLAARA